MGLMDFTTRRSFVSGKRKYVLYERFIWVFGHNSVPKDTFTPVHKDSESSSIFCLSPAGNRAIPLADREFFN